MAGRIIYICIHDSNKGAIYAHNIKRECDVQDTREQLVCRNEAMHMDS